MSEFPDVELWKYDNKGQTAKVFNGTVAAQAGKRWGFTASEETTRPLRELSTLSRDLNVKLRKIEKLLNK